MNEFIKEAMESGRPLAIYYINEVHQLNPNATQVTNHYYGDQFVPKDIAREESATPEDATRNPQLQTENILEYVMKLHPTHVRPEWRDKYRPLWEELLRLPEVASLVHHKGKQQGTTFNRSLVANILHLMAERKVLFTANATKLAELLEGDKDSSVRGRLGEMPPRAVKEAVENFLSENAAS